MILVIVFWWLVIALAVGVGWSIAGHHIKQQRAREYELYGLRFGNTGELRRRFLESQQAEDAF